MDYINAESILRRRLQFLPEKPIDWQTKVERVVLQILVGDYELSSRRIRKADLKRYIIHRTNWLQARIAVRASEDKTFFFDESELAAIRFMVDYHSLGFTV